MSFQVYTTEKSEEWDKIVKSFPDYDVYYLSGYAKACEVHGDGEGFLFYMETDNGRGMNVTMRTKLDETYRKQKTPYGYGGPLLEGISYDDFWKEYETWSVEHHVVLEFFRYHPLLQNQSPTAMQVGSTVAIDTNCNPEDLTKNFHPSCRNKIRKAEKNHLTVRKTRDLSVIPLFQEIYKETMDRDDATEYYYFKPAYYETLLEMEETTFYLVESAGKAVASGIFFTCQGKGHYHLSGSMTEYMKLAPINLLLYEVSLDCIKEKISDLHLGGGNGGVEDSLFRFKKNFNKDETMPFFTEEKIYLQEMRVKFPEA